ncbi:MAG: transposase [Actinomycetota bacterium]|nr:transposase [Actinomycetota bacterium]
MPGPTPHYPPEFKREAVELYRSSEKSIPKMAEELGIASESMRRWIRQHEVDEGEREGLTTDEREELSKLRRENKTLRQEREFLKKQPSSLRRRAGDKVQPAEETVAKDQGHHQERHEQAHPTVPPLSGCEREPHASKIPQ